MCQCRIVKDPFHNLPSLFGRYKHTTFKAKFTCPMCWHTGQKFITHTCNTDWRDNSSYYECDRCHDYIRYAPCKVEKEFFFVLNYCVIMLKDKVVLELPNHKEIALPFFVFEDKDNLIKKVKNYVIFS